jgi:hypothetical protein
MLGVAAMIVVFILMQRSKLDEKNKKSRIVIHFNEIKKDFVRQMDKFNQVYLKENFFLNEYSKGLHHHIAFDDEKLDIIKWIEKVETKLQDESIKQFEEFEKSLEPMDDLGVSKVKGIAKHMNGGEDEETITYEVSLRDTTSQIKMIDKIEINTVDEKSFKEILAEIKIILNDYYRRNENSFRLWADLNNQGMDYFRKLFSSKTDKKSDFMSVFCLTVEDLKEGGPSLISETSTMTKFIGGPDAIQESLEKLYMCDWDTLRMKITYDNSSLIDKNNIELKVVIVYEGN